MIAFARSLELLRENRYVDYKQVGLNYQLYSCEVSTNFTENLSIGLSRYLWRRWLIASYLMDKSEENSEPSQTYKKELFAKILNG